MKTRQNKSADRFPDGRARDILDAVERGELVGEPGLVARLEGAALALEALAEVQTPGR